MCHKKSSTRHEIRHEINVTQENQLQENAPQPAQSPGRLPYELRSLEGNHERPLPIENGTMSDAKYFQTLEK